MAKYATRQEFMNSFNSPVLYVSFENKETIVAKREREIKKGSPARRYRKGNDEIGEYVWIKGIGSKFKSYRKDWLMQ